jgi:hypothetical protein
MHRMWESRQIEADGIAAVLKAMHFPLFALIDILERFPVTSYQWGSGWATGKTQPLLSNLDLRYEGPDYPKNHERIAIDQRGKEINPESRLIDRASYPIHTSYIVYFLASLTGTEEPGMQALHQGMAIYQYVNIGAILLTPAVKTSIQARTGEVVSWSHAGLIRIEGYDVTGFDILYYINILLESVDAIEQRGVSALVRGFYLILPLFSFNSHLSPKNPAAAIRPGARVEAGVLKSITAQSGSFGVWRALLE